MNETLRRTWPIVLVDVVALLYLWVGIAAHGWDSVWGLAGGLLILTAVAVARRSLTVAIALVLIGALPLAIATWWSIATPVLAILAIVLGLAVIRGGRQRRGHTAEQHPEDASGRIPADHP